MFKQPPSEKVKAADVPPIKGLSSQDEHAYELP